MSWIERAIEERLANAVAGGELDTPALNGHQLDLDTPRPQGWWADQFARRELSHDRRLAAEAAAARATAGFWRATRLDDLRGRVRDANAEIGRENINLIDTDRLVLFDLDVVEARWHRLRRPHVTGTHDRHA